MTDQSIERVEEPVPPTPGRPHLMAFIATPEQRALCTCKPDKQEGYHKRDCPTVIAALKRPERPAPQAAEGGMRPHYTAAAVGIALIVAGLIVFAVAR